MTFIKLVHRKNSHPATFDPYCVYCDLLLIRSKLPGGVNRYLCSQCHRTMYIDDHNCELRGYHPTFFGKEKE